MTGWGGEGQRQWDAHTRLPSVSTRPPLGYLRPGVSEQEAAGSIPGTEEDEWTKGHLETFARLNAASRVLGLSVLEAHLSHQSRRLVAQALSS